jgi:hypothetical protein
VRLLEVVPDDLLGALLPLLEPGGETLVEVAARLLRDPGIGDFTDQHVVEAESIVALFVGAHGPDQASADEGKQPPVGASELIRRSQLHDGSASEFAACDCGPLEQGAFLRLKPVEAACEQGFDGGRQRLDGFWPCFLEEGEQLLDKEWVSLGDLDNARSRRLSKLLSGELADEHLGFSLLERLEPDHIGVGDQGRPFLLELGSRKADDQQRRLDRPRGEVLDEVQQRGLRPVNVLEQDD